MAVKFELEENLSTELMEIIGKLPNEGECIVNDVFHNEGTELIKEGITILLPVSGRKWKKKKRAAKVAKPFKSINSNLAVTVFARSGYGYLYFPDDGSNTKKHEGNQHFMLKGAENQSGKIIDICLDKLKKAIES